MLHSITYRLPLFIVDRKSKIFSISNIPNTNYDHTLYIYNLHHNMKHDP